MENQKKKTMVLGASPNPGRYSYLALQDLLSHGHPVVAIGKSPARNAGVAIQTGMPYMEDLHTVSVYLNARNQKPYEDYVISLKPRRVIFNPGAENPLWEARLLDRGISVHRACTLVMLRTGAY